MSVSPVRAVVLAAAAVGSGTGMRLRPRRHLARAPV